MTGPSRADRHTVRLARLRTARWMMVGGVVLGLASGLLLALFAADRPIRVVGLLVVALSVVQALSPRVVTGVRRRVRAGRGVLRPGRGGQRR